MASDSPRTASANQYLTVYGGVPFAAHVTRTADSFNASACKATVHDKRNMANIFRGSLQTFIPSHVTLNYWQNSVTLHKHWHVIIYNRMPIYIVSENHSITKLDTNPLWSLSAHIKSKLAVTICNFVQITWKLSPYNTAKIHIQFQQFTTANTWRILYIQTVTCQSFQQAYSG